MRHPKPQYAGTAHRFYMELMRTPRVPMPDKAWETSMGKGLLLWLIGIPLPIILLVWLLGGLS